MQRPSGSRAAQPVKVTGKGGSAVLEAKVTADIKKGVVSMPATFAAAAVKVEKVTEGA